MKKDQGVNLRSRGLMESAQYTKLWRCMLFDQTLSDGALRLWGILRDRCTNKASTWVSVACLAKDLGVTGRTIENRAHELVDRGLIEREERQGQTNIWWLNQVDSVYPPEKLLMSLPKNEVDTPEKNCGGTPEINFVPTPEKNFGQSESKEKDEQLRDEETCSHASRAHIHPTSGNDENPGPRDVNDRPVAPPPDSAAPPAPAKVKDTPHTCATSGSGIIVPEDETERKIGQRKVKAIRINGGKTGYGDWHKAVEDWNQNDAADYFKHKFQVAFPDATLLVDIKHLMSIKLNIGYLLGEGKSPGLVQQVVDFIFDNWSVLKDRLKWKDAAPGLALISSRSYFGSILVMVQTGGIHSSMDRCDPALVGKGPQFGWGDEK